MPIYLKQAFKLSLIIVYFSNPSMYENILFQQRGYVYLSSIRVVKSS